MLELLDFSDTTRREKARFWVEVIGFLITILSIWFAIVQVIAQKRATVIQTILQIEDSERFINQLSLERPEFALLIEHAGRIINAHNIIKELDITNDAEIEIMLRHTEESDSRSSSHEEDHNKVAIFMKHVETLLHLLPASEIIAFYETTSKDGIPMYARFQASVAIVEQLRARVDIVGFILLQEFEKMFRICDQGVIEEEFWRGENAYEDLIFNLVKTDALRAILNDSEKARGFYPAFLTYLRDLQNFKDGEQLQKQFQKKYCKFKKESTIAWLFGTT